MTAKKGWAELAPSTRQRRMERFTALHLPKPKQVVTFAQKHAKCANKGNCTGPGCRVTRYRAPVAVPSL